MAGCSGLGVAAPGPFLWPSSFFQQRARKARYVNHFESIRLPVDLAAVSNSEPAHETDIFVR